MLTVKKCKHEIVLCGIIAGLFLLILGIMCFVIVLPDPNSIWILVVVLGLILIDFLVCFIVTKLTNHKYYVISEKGIEYYCKGKKVFFVSKGDIASIEYTPLSHYLFFDLTAGSMLISIDGRGQNPNDELSIINSNHYSEMLNAAFIPLSVNKKNREEIFKLLGDPSHE